MMILDGLGGPLLLLGVVLLGMSFQFALTADTAHADGEKTACRVASVVGTTLLVGSAGAFLLGIVALVLAP